MCVVDGRQGTPTEDAPKYELPRNKQGIWRHLEKDYATTPRRQKRLLMLALNEVCGFSLGFLARSFGHTASGVLRMVRAAQNDIKQEYEDPRQRVTESDCSDPDELAA